MLAVATFFALTTLAAQPGPPMTSCWNFTKPVSVKAGLAVDTSGVYLVDSENRVTALDRRRGSVIWTAELGGSVDAEIVNALSSLVVLTKTQSSDPGASGYFLRAISKETGITRWVTKLPAARNYRLQRVSENLFLVEDGVTVSAINVADGAKKWERMGVTAIRSDGRNLAGTLVLVKDSDGIQILSTIDGRVLGRLGRKPFPTVFASRLPETKIFGDSRGIVESKSDGEGVEWTYKTGGAVSDLIVVGDEVIAASADNFLYSISLDSGNIEWKRKMPGRINSTHLLGVEKIVLTVVGDKSAYILDISDGKFLEQLVLPGEEEYIGHPLKGDAEFVAALTSKGVAAFASGCRTEKAANKAAALKKSLY